MPKRNDINKVLIIGSGPIIIGQACEFDYSGTQACKALRKLGYEIVLVKFGLVNSKYEFGLKNRRKSKDEKYFKSRIGHCITHVPSTFHTCHGC